MSQGLLWNDFPTAPLTPRGGEAGTPGLGPEGETCETCETCKHDVRRYLPSGRYCLKCLLMRDRWTYGAARSPACERWEKGET